MNFKKEELNKAIQKVELLIAQADDMERIVSDSFYSKQAWVNFKQRQRFIACTFAKNAEEALTNLYNLEVKN